MALRLGEHVACGELYNTRKNSVHGWLGLRGTSRRVLLGLTGNCSPDLAGRQIRFEMRDAEPVECDDEEEDQAVLKRLGLAGLAWQQIGPVGTITAARKVRVTDCPPAELYMRCKLDEPPPTEWKRCLYLEWYSQNGRVVVELLDPIIEVTEPTEPEPPLALPATSSQDPGPDDVSGPSDDEESDVPPFGDEDAADRDDPYNLFPSHLQEQFDAEARETDLTIRTDDESDSTIRELKLMDELIERGESVPLEALFDEAVRLPRPDTLNDTQVEAELWGLLARLAMVGVSLDMCEHFTPRDAYRLLVEQLMHEPGAYRELRGTGWVQHVSTWEFCPACEAEFEREAGPQPDPDKADE